MTDRLLDLYQGAGYLGLAVLVGGLFAQELLLLGRPHPRIRLGALLGCGILLLSSGALAWGTVYQMLGEVSSKNLATFVQETHPGRMLVWRVGLAVVLTLGSFVPVTTVRRVLCAAAATGLAFTFASVSHARIATGLLPPLADMVHVLAATCWAGLLWYFAWLGPGLYRTQSAPTGLVDRLSNAALGSVALLAVTGAYGMWLHLPTVRAVWSSGWGRLLLWKLGVVGLTLAIAGYNRWRLVPHQQAPDMGLRLCRTVLVESIAVVAILLTTGFLARTDPPDADTGSQRFKPQSAQCRSALWNEAVSVTDSGGRSST